MGVVSHWGEGCRYLFQKTCEETSAGRKELPRIALKLVDQDGAGGTVPTFGVKQGLGGEETKGDNNGYLLVNLPSKEALPREKGRVRSGNRPFGKKV